MAGLNILYVIANFDKAASFKIQENVSLGVNDLQSSRFVFLLRGTELHFQDGPIGICIQDRISSCGGREAIKLGGGALSLTTNFRHDTLPSLFLIMTKNTNYIFMILLTYLLTYGAEPFLRSRQLCNHSENSQQL
jgi:hypothetical protein